MGSSKETEIWVVEDNDLLRESIEIAINRADGMCCSLAVDRCEDALEELERSAAPDIVLMDIGLPGMSGIEGAGRIHERSPATQVIILTVHEDNEKIFEALCAGATGYLVKPASATDVVAAIQELIGGGVPMNAQVARKVLGMFTSLALPKGGYGLTAREVEILELLVEGLTQNQIAEKLIRSEHTVNTHIRNIYAKLHVRTRSSAVAKAVKERLI